MRGVRAAAAALAGGLAFGNPCTPAPSTTKPPKPPHVSPASQPASAPASQPAALDELLVYRMTQRGEHDGLIADAAERWGLSPWLVRGLLHHESRLQARARNENTGALGVGQFVPSGAAAVGRLQRARGVARPFTYRDALDPRLAIPAAAEMLAYLYDVCGGVWCALAGYNSGSVRAVVTGFVRSVEKHMNRFRCAAGLPPEPPLERPRPARRTQRQRPES